MANYIKENFDPATLESLANFICGNDEDKFPVYRSSSYLTKFFNDLSILEQHDGSTRKWWVLDVLKKLSLEELESVVLRLVDIREYKGNKEELKLAQKAMSDILFMENMDIVFKGRNPIIVPLKISDEPIIQDENVDIGEEEFLNKDFTKNDISKLKLDGQVEVILKERILEARNNLKNKAPLSCIFMTGSVLEGILLGVATENPKKFNQAKSAPKEKGKIKQFHEWTLADFINVSCELDFLGLDVKKFSHAMRDFRNYIHPYQQLSLGFNPDEHTAKMCLQALNAAIADLIKVTK